MAQEGASELPLCPICCDWLGKYGGPSTLPCGHNGCLECWQSVQACKAECPLCRSPFDAGVKLACNTELRDLIALATASMMDDKTRDEGWEAFPTASVTNEHYALTTHAEQQQQQRRAHHAYPSVPSHPLSFQGCYGPAGTGGSQQQQQQQQHQQQHCPAAPAGRSSGCADSLGPPTTCGANGSNGGGCSSGAVGGQQQYHAQYHQHPGLPTSAPSAAHSSVLHWDPPQWLPDSYAPNCGGCHNPFKPLLRLRHHCRLCGKIFCQKCSEKRMLLPPRFRERAPQRCCELCAALLEPLQAFLIAANAAACQPPVHDALDAVCLRSWLNQPWGSCMADEVFKAANIVRAFTQALRPEVEKGLPASLLRGTRGLALLSVMRVGAGWSCTAGTGLLVTRQRNGGWSAPCAISCCGLGWGLVLGGQLTDVLLVLRSDDAVRALAAGRALGVGGAAGLALGPLGRSAEASLQLGGVAARGSVVGWSCSRGVFAGLSLEGTVTSVRDAVNMAFYGYAASPRQLLLDCVVPQPPAAALLYQQLGSLTALWESRGARLGAPALAAAAAAGAGAAAAAQRQGVAAAAAAAVGCGGASSSSSRSAAAAAAVGAGAPRGGGAADDALAGFEADGDDSEYDCGCEGNDAEVDTDAHCGGQLPEAGVCGAVPVAAAATGGAPRQCDARYAASAPPAPSSVLAGLFSPRTAAAGGSCASAGASRQQPQQQSQQGPAAGSSRAGQTQQQQQQQQQREAQPEEEEQLYVLEW